MIVAIVAPVRANAARPAVTVEIESIDNLISDVTTASKTLGQKTMEPAMMRGAIGEALNAPGLVGIDTTKPIQIHVFLPKVKADDPAFTPDKLMPLSAFVLPLSDNGQAFSSAVKSRFPVSKKTGSVHHFSQPATGGEEPPQGLYLAALGKRVITSKQPGAAEAALASLKAHGTPSPAVRFPGTVRVYVSIETAATFVETALIPGAGDDAQTRDAGRNANGSVRHTRRRGEGPSPVDARAAQLHSGHQSFFHHDRRL
jgi:hypothetical protein